MNYKAILRIVLVACVLHGAVQPALATSVVFLNPGKKGEVFWDMVTETMQSAAHQFGFSIEVVYAERNYRSMQVLGIDVAERAIKPDFLVLVNEDAAARPILEAAEQNGIKTLLLSNTLAGDDAKVVGPPRTTLQTWLGSIVPDMEGAGARMAEALVESARLNKRFSPDGKIHILAIGGDEITPSSVARNRGFLQAVARHSDVVVDRFLIANWNKTDAEAATENYLAWAHRKGIRVAGIWAANDPMALGAMAAVEKAQLRPGADVTIVGLNWSRDALSEVAAGRMLLTDGGHFLAGAWAMVVLKDYIEGCDFADQTTEILFATSAISSVNIMRIRELIENAPSMTIDFGAFSARQHGRCGIYDFSLDALLAASANSAPSR